MHNPLHAITSALDAPGRAARSALMSILGTGVPNVAPGSATLGDFASLGGGMMNAPSPGMENPLARMGMAAMSAQSRLPKGVSYVDDPMAERFDFEPPPKPAEGSILPLLAGLAAGGLSAFVPGLGVFAPAIGAGTMGLAQGLSELIAPEQIGSFSAGDVNARLADLTGAEFLRENPIADFVTHAATDPLSYVAAHQGIKALGPTQAEQRLGRLATAERAVGQRPLSPPLAGAPSPMIAPDFPPGFTPTAAAPEVLGGYNAEQLGRILNSPLSDVVPAGVGRAKPYKLVNEQVSPLLRELGFIDEAGQMAGALPSWAQVRGGRVMPNPDMAMQMAHLGDISGLAGYQPGASVARFGDRMRAIGAL